MKPIIKHTVVTALVLAVGFVAAVIIFIQSGVYDFAADVPHTPLVFSLLDRMRERSITTRADGIKTPDLTDQRRIVQGSGNYNAMCVQCHRSPGMGETELSKGLYPTPPNLTERATAPSHAFWVIKHGIKASGMPAWGMSMNDEDVWNMVAFLQEMPKLDADRYKEMVARSGGHRHHHGSAHDEDADHNDDHNGKADQHGPSK